MVTRVAGLCLGLLFLWLGLRTADLDQVVRAVGAADFLASGAVLGLALAFIAVKALRWQYILRPLESVRFSLLHRLVYIGTSSNMIIPHSGELLRSTKLARQTMLASGTVLGTIAIERILDFATLALVAALAIVIDPTVSLWLWSAGLIGLLCVIGGVAVVVAVLDPNTPLKRIWNWIVYRLPASRGERLGHHIQRGIEGLGTLRSPRRLLTALAWSLLQWSLVVAAVRMSAIAVGVDLPVSAAIAVFVLTVIGLTQPSAPAQLGTTQLAFVVGMGIAEIDSESALAASLVYNVWFVVTMLVVGLALWFFFRLPRRAPA